MKGLILAGMALAASSAAMISPVEAGKSRDFLARGAQHAPRPVPVWRQPRLPQPVYRPTEANIFPRAPMPIPNRIRVRQNYRF